MVQGRHKSGSMRKVFVRTPGGKTVVHYRLAPKGRPRCGITGQFLHGVSRPRKGLSKTKRTVSRAFGGTLSSPAARSQIKFAARLIE